MKFYNYAAIAVGLALLFQLAGIPVATGLLDWTGATIGGALNISFSPLWNLLFGGAGILILATITGVVVGFLTKTSPENYIVLGFIVTCGTFLISTALGVTRECWKLFPPGSPFVWFSYIVTFIMTLLTVLFIINIPLDTFRGGS